MDFVLDSPLNRAHRFSRLADKQTQKGLFDQAIENHDLAIKNLQEALTATDNNLAQESMKLQLQYHSKRQEILRIKKKHYLALKEAALLQKAVMSRVSRKTPSDSDETLQKAIYRTFEEADSLIELLGQKKDPEPEKLVETSQSVTGVKKPKDDAVVIEELRIVNCQLRNLITQLMTELASSERQAESLKKRIIELEAGCSCRRNAEAKNEQDDEGPMSRYLGDEFSVDLPPLELPHFDTEMKSS